MNKREIFLEKLEERYRDYNSLIGPGIYLKIKKFFYIPIKYSKYILWRLGILKRLNAELFWGRKIIFGSSKAFGTEICFLGILDGKNEEKLTKFLIKNLKDTDIFYDVGANYGYYTYLALEFCKEVHIFEPLPEVFNSLKINLSDVKNVFLNNIALADQEGSTELYVLGPSSTIKEDARGYFSHATQKIFVKTTALDKYLETHNKPIVIKIDVEGAESLVIDGGINFFSNNNPIIAMEVWGKNNGGEISMKAVEKLKKLGFKPYFINDNGDLENCEEDLLELMKLKNLIVDNFVFKKQ